MSGSSANDGEVSSNVLVRFVVGPDDDNDADADPSFCFWSLGPCPPARPLPADEALAPDDGEPL